MSDQRSRDGSVHVTDERINTITAMAGALFGLLGTAVLVATAVQGRDWWRIGGLALYGFGLISLFVMSSLHHAIDGSPRTNSVLRKLDYSSIFVLIAGTATPIVLAYGRTPFGWAVLGSLWATAVLGIALVASVGRLPKHITNTFYIVMGWMPVVLLAGIPYRFSPLALGLLAGGGLIYSAGFVIYTSERPNLRPGIFGFHELWHSLILFAALSHFLFMYFYVA